MTWPTPCRPVRRALACGSRRNAPASDGSAPAGRSHRRPHANWSSAHRGSGQWRQLEPSLLPLPHRHGLSRWCCRSGRVQSPACRQTTKEPFPYACVRPAPEPRMNPEPLAEHLRQITPSRRVASHSQDGIHKQPVVDPTPSRSPDPPRKMALDPHPLLVRQRSSAQSPAPSPALNQNAQSNENPLNADSALMGRTIKSPNSLYFNQNGRGGGGGEQAGHAPPPG